MAEYDTVPQEAENKQDALEESGVAERTNREEVALEQPPSHQEDPISSGEDERPPRLTDCRKVGCTWPCTHHDHLGGVHRSFLWWNPGLERFNRRTGVQLEKEVGRKDGQFCGIFFSILQSDGCLRANADHDHTLKSGVCRLTHAMCWCRSNGQLSQVEMYWNCGGEAFYELGLPIGKVV